MLKSAATMCAAVLLASTSSGALAQSLTWRISEAAGAVSVRHGAELRPAARNAVLAPGDAIVTGAGGRAVLVHDRDFVTVSANSRVTVPVAQEAGGFTQIVQDLGNAIFRIEKLKVPHFAVKTPYLAAVVKGTTFSVTVDGTGTSLQVVEGAVEVATLDGGAKDLIRPGTVATIGASDLFRLQVQGDSARTIDSPARAVDAPAAAPAPAATSAVPAEAAVPVAAAPAATPVETAKVDPVGADSGRQTIGEAISSKPVDLASITGGMMTGTTAAAPAMLVAAVKLESVVPAPAPASTPTASPATLPSAAAPVVQPSAPVITAADTAPVVQPSPTVIAAADAAPVVAPAIQPSTPAVGSPTKVDAGATAPVPVAEVAKGDSPSGGPKADTPAKPPVGGPKAEAPPGPPVGDPKGGPAVSKGSDDGKKAADDLAKAQDKAAKDAAKAADDAAKDNAKAAADAKKAADDAKKAADDAKKAADDAAKNAAKAASNGIQNALDLAAVPEHVLDLPSIPRRAAVIGGGNTGAQLVTILSALGSRVTLLDVAPRVLAATDEDVSTAVRDAFVEQGVSVRTGIDGVDALERASEGIALRWREGGETAEERFDAVIMATGWPADVEDLRLAAAGIEPVRSSIPVDRYFRSAVPHILAIGDATGRDMLVQAAQSEGEAAAENAVLDANRIPRALLPAGGFTDPDYADVGLTEAEARGRDPLSVVATVPYSQLDRAVIDDRERGFLKLIADRRRELILGAHAVGENAIEVVQSVTTAMAAGVDVSTLAAVRFAYPTYSAIIGMAARALLTRTDRGPDASDPAGAELH